MTPSHQPSKNRARVRKISRDWLGTLFIDFPAAEYKRGQTVLVIPCPSLKSARARKKWEEMSEEEKVLTLISVFEGCAMSDEDTFESNAKAVLAVTEGRG